MNKITESWIKLKKMAAVAQTNEPRNPNLPLWIFVKLEGEDIDRDGFI